MKLVGYGEETAGALVVVSDALLATFPIGGRHTEYTANLILVGNEMRR